LKSFVQYWPSVGTSANLWVCRTRHLRSNMM